MAASAECLNINEWFKSAAGPAPRRAGPAAVRIDNVLTTPGKCLPTGLSGLNSRLMSLPCRNWLSL